ncbi:MAG: hypothetical protein HQL40_20980 [Alphaproteobacteria bacterium]|nr:hypothetical protein [Alphaproteobacteria bacterium]
MLQVPASKPAVHHVGVADLDGPNHHHVLLMGGIDHRVDDVGSLRRFLEHVVVRGWRDDDTSTRNLYRRELREGIKRKGIEPTIRTLENQKEFGKLKVENVISATVVFVTPAIQRWRHSFRYVPGQNAECLAGFSCRFSRREADRGDHGVSHNGRYPTS